jgi:hypothetical protein
MTWEAKGEPIDVTNNLGGLFVDEATDEDVAEVRRKWEAVAGEIFDRLDAALTVTFSDTPTGSACLALEPVTLSQLGLLDLVHDTGNWSKESELTWWLSETYRRGTVLHLNWTGSGPPSWDDWVELLGPRPGASSRGYIYLDTNGDIGREWTLLASVEPFDDPDLIGSVLVRLLPTADVADILYGSLPSEVAVGDGVGLREEVLLAVVHGMSDLLQFPDVTIDVVEEAGRPTSLRIEY